MFNYQSVQALERCWPVSMPWHSSFTLVCHGL